MHSKMAAHLFVLIVGSACNRQGDASLLSSCQSQAHILLCMLQWEGCGVPALSHRGGLQPSCKHFKEAANKNFADLACLDSSISKQGDGYAHQRASAALKISASLCLAFWHTSCRFALHAAVIVATVHEGKQQSVP